MRYPNTGCVPTIVGAEHFKLKYLGNFRRKNVLKSLQSEQVGPGMSL